jgi:hypothetical protein
MHGGNGEIVAIREIYKSVLVFILYLRSKTLNHTLSQLVKLRLKKN